MGIPVVIKASGGLPVTVATSGYGTPMTVASNGYGIAITQVASGGLPVVGVTFGPSIVLSNYIVYENAAVNTVVGTLSMSGTTGTPTYTLTDSAGGKFNISGSSLRTNALLDYETAASHNITVSVSGVAPAVSATNFTVVVLDVTTAAPAAPVLLLTSGPTDNTPDFTLAGDLLLGDTVRFQYSTAIDFTGASELTNTVDAGEDAANSVAFTTGALANNTWYFRARIERPDALTSGWSNTESVTIVAGSSYDAATTAWISAVTTAGGTVSDLQKGRVDALIVALKAHGLFSANSRLWLHAGESVSQQATIDIMGLATATNSGASLSANGYTGNGTSTYVNLGSFPSDFTQTSSTYGVYNVLNSAAINSGIAIGSYGTSPEVALNDLGPLSNDFGPSLTGCRYNGVTAMTFANTNRRGLYVCTGTTLTDSRLYLNNVEKDTEATTKRQIPTGGGFYVLARNDSGAASNFSADVIAASFVMAGMNATQVGNFSTDLNAYMTAWGINVY